jgi:hypothetical protein
MNIGSHTYRAVEYLRDNADKNEHWLGDGFSYTTHNGFHCIHNTWVNIVPNTIDFEYRVSKLHLFDPSTDAITRVQIVVGDDPNAEFAADNYTEMVARYDGATYTTVPVALCNCQSQKVWIRGIIAGAVDDFFKLMVCIQKHKEA